MRGGPPYLEEEFLKGKKCFYEEINNWIFKGGVSVEKRPRTPLGEGGNPWKQGSRRLG